MQRRVVRGCRSRGPLLGAGQTVCPAEPGLPGQCPCWHLRAAGRLDVEVTGQLLHATRGAPPGDGGALRHPAAGRLLTHLVAHRLCQI
eukprot:scaffold8513_cov111-Isochrysis_galbana.AAC.2